MTEIIFRRVLGFLFEVDIAVHGAIEIVLDRLDDLREAAMTACKALPLLHVLEDTRQQVQLVWPDGVIIESATLKEGDFTTPALRGIAAIELKRADYAASVGRDRERVDREIERLQPYRWKCVVVADDITAVYRRSLLHPNSILGTIASLYARHDVPTIFVGNDAGAARLIAGLLRRWQERVEAEREAESAAPTFEASP